MKVYNSTGQLIKLGDREQRIANSIQRQIINNDLGYDVDITTLTTIIKKVTEQKFFEIAPADYLPVRVGEGSFSQQLLTYRSFDVTGSFANGVINLSKTNGRLATADAGVDAIAIAIQNWAKEINWTLFEIEQATKANSWDLITAKAESRLKNWQLGIQSVAFLGLDGVGSCLGLLNQAVTTNTDLLLNPISSLSPNDLKYFCANVLNVYRANNNRTAWPTHFIIPESDYLGLAAPSSADFPLKSALQVLEETFQTMTKNKNFKIMPLAYCDGAYNTTDSANQTYVLLNYDEASIRMDIPVDYTSTLANSVNNFSFANVGYGQFTGVMAYRPLEMLYFKFPVGNLVPTP